MVKTHGRLAAVAALVVLSLGTFLQPAQAAPQDGRSDNLEFLFSYNSKAYGYGSFSDFYSSQPNLVGYVFLSYGAGRGQFVKNNAGAATNRDITFAYVYYNSYYGGRVDKVLGNTTRDLFFTKNDNASFRWLS
jgi:hypothetical protein